MIPARFDFAELKRRVSVERVLDAEGLLGGFTARGDVLYGPCPVHGGDNPRAFVVTRSKNLWHCFTKCQAGGDVVELVQRLFRLDYRRTARRLAAYAGRSAVSADRRGRPASGAASRRSEVHPFTPYRRRLALEPRCSFLAGKGIRPETATRYETGLYRGPGFLAGCVGVRLRDADGRPLGYAGRRVDAKAAATAGKWKLPRAFPAAKALYNYHRARRNLDRPVAVTEGPWDVMRLAQLGIPAVALMGTCLSPRRADLLARFPKTVVLMDGDPAGRSAAVEIRRRLSGRVPLVTVDLPNDRDPADLTDGELIARLGSLFF